MPDAKNRFLSGHTICLLYPPGTVWEIPGEPLLRFYENVHNDLKAQSVLQLYTITGISAGPCAQADIFCRKPVKFCNIGLQSIHMSGILPGADAFAPEQRCVSQRCCRIASCFGLALTQTSGTVIFAMPYQELQRFTEPAQSMLWKRGDKNFILTASIALSWKP